MRRDSLFYIQRDFLQLVALLGLLQFSGPIAQAAGKKTPVKRTKSCSEAVEIIDVNSIASALTKLSSLDPRQMPEIRELLTARIKDETFFKDPEKIAQAKKAVMNALLGMVLRELTGSPEQNVAALNTTLPGQRPLLVNIMDNWRVLSVALGRDSEDLSQSVSPVITALLDQGAILPETFHAFRMEMTPLQLAIHSMDYDTAAVVVVRSGKDMEVQLNTLGYFDRIQVEEKIRQLKSLQAKL